MNREIKFRAWLRVDYDFADEGYKMVYDLAFEEYLPVNDQLASVKHLMQFTGLKDKNGKEIYEGDKDKKGRVCHYFEKLGAFGFKHPMYAAITFLGQWVKMEGEIVGNIYENPDLIKIPNVETPGETNCMRKIVTNPS